jgi:glutamine synthetase adenylyltransferase
MMHKHESEQAFLEAVKAGLDKAEDAVDDLTLMRLRQLRKQALQSVSESSAPAVVLREQWWMPLTSVAATVLIAVLGFHMTTQITSTVAPQDDTFSALEDMQILGAEQSLDFYQDLEFYQWLDEQKDLG